MRILNEESLFAPVDAERPLGAVLQTVLRRAAAAEQLAVPPVARLQLLTRRGALTACFTVLVAISVVNAADAPPRYRSPVRRVCVCVERKRVTQTAASREPATVSCLKRFCVRQSVTGKRGGEKSRGIAKNRQTQIANRSSPSGIAYDRHRVPYTVSRCSRAARCRVYLNS